MFSLYLFMMAFIIICFSLLPSTCHNFLLILSRRVSLKWRCQVEIQLCFLFVCFNIYCLLFRFFLKYCRYSIPFFFVVIVCFGSGSFSKHCWYSIPFFFPNGHFVSMVTQQTKHWPTCLALSLRRKFLRHQANFQRRRWVFLLFRFGVSSLCCCCFSWLIALLAAMLAFASAIERL